MRTKNEEPPPRRRNVQLRRTRQCPPHLARPGRGDISRARVAETTCDSASAAYTVSKAAKAARLKADLIPPQVAKAGPTAGIGKAAANFAAAAASGSAAVAHARQLAGHGGGKAVDRTLGGQDLTSNTVRRRAADGGGGSGSGGGGGVGGPGGSAGPSAGNCTVANVLASHCNS